MLTFDYLSLIQKNFPSHSNPVFDLIYTNLPPLHNAWIAGGSIRRSLFPKTHESVLNSDIDIFFKSRDDFDAYWENMTNSAKIVIESTKANCYNTQHCISLTARDFDGSFRILKLKIQLVTFSYYDDIEALLNSFDFTICQFGFDGTTVYAGDNSFQDLANTELNVHKVRYPIESMRRAIKYAKQGFLVTDDTLKSLATFIAKNPEAIKEYSGYYPDGTNR